MRAGSASHPQRTRRRKGIARYRLAGAAPRYPVSAVDLSEHFRFIWRHRWRVLFASLLIGGLVYGYSKTRPKVYRADSVLSVTPGRAAGETITQDITLFLTRTYSSLATTRSVVADALNRSGQSLKLDAAQHRVSASASSDVGFLTISATGPTPRSATGLAQALADATIDSVQHEQISALDRQVKPLQDQANILKHQLDTLSQGAPDRSTLETQYTSLLQAINTAQLRPADQLTQVQPARSSGGPVSPTPLRNAVLALIAALILNSELTVLLEVLSDRFKSEDEENDVHKVTGLPILARVPKGKGSDVLEAFRTLRTNLMFMQSANRLRSVAVVSVDPSTGKSFTVIKLGEAIADLEVPVVVIDGDLRRPVLHDRMDVPRQPGLTEALGSAGMDGGPATTSCGPYLSVLTAGSVPPDPSGILTNLRPIVDSLPAALVIIDTPAEQLFADAMAIASQCDATIIVVDMRTTRRRAVRRMIERLRQVNAEPIGVVVNRTRSTPRARYYYSSETRAARAVR